MLPCPVRVCLPFPLTATYVPFRTNSFVLIATVMCIFQLPMRVCVSIHALGPACTLFFLVSSAVVFLL